MTDRVIYLTVALEEPTRDDDVQATVQAIQQIRGVAKVELGEPVGGNDYFMREIARRELIGEVIDLLDKK